MTCLLKFFPRWWYKNPFNLAAGILAPFLLIRLSINPILMDIVGYYFLIFMGMVMGRMMVSRQRIHHGPRG
jgi:hypothetical protein